MYCNSPKPRALNPISLRTKGLEIEVEENFDVDVKIQQYHA